MHKVLSGFASGYLMIVLVAGPALLCALGKAPSYGDAVTIVLNHTGVLGRVRSGLDEAALIRDQLMNELAVYIARKLGPQLPAESKDAHFR